MKRLFFITLLFVSFGLFSCKNSFFSGAQGSISFDAGSTAEYFSRSATKNIVALQANNNSYDETQFFSYTIKVRIETEGNYKGSAENVYSKKLNEILNAANQEMAIISFIKDSLSQPISINGIPVGSNVKVNLSITNTVSFDADAFKQSLAGENLPQSYIDFIVDSMVQESVDESETWYGESETFVVRKGENKVNIRLKGINFSDYEYGEEELGTNIILYNSDALYSFPPNLLSTKKMLRPQEYSLPNGFSDFVIDSENNIYCIVFGEYDDDAGVTPYSIYKNETEIHSSSIGEQTEYFGIYFEQTTGLLFFGARNMGSYEESFAIDTKSNEIIYDVAIIPESDTYCFAISFDEPKVEDENIVYEGYSFIAKILQSGVQNKSLQFETIPIRYAISPTEKRIETNGSEKSNDLYSGAPGFTNSLSENVVITDMIVQDGTLYALLREVTPLNEEYDKTIGFTGNTPNPIDMGTIKSRGALVSIDIAYFDDASSIKVLSDSSVVTPRDISIPFDFSNPHTGSDDQGTINFTIYQPNENFAFFGPERFIAIKPGKLVIADDGYFYYKGNDNKLHIKNCNRVVEVDISEFSGSMTSTDIRTTIPIKFSEERTDDIEIRCNAGNDATTVTCVVDN